MNATYVTRSLLRKFISSNIRGHIRKRSPTNARHVKRSLLNDLSLVHTWKNIILKVTEIEFSVLFADLNYINDFLFFFFNLEIEICLFFFKLLYFYYLIKKRYIKNKTVQIHPDFLFLAFFSLF